MTENYFNAAHYAWLMEKLGKISSSCYHFLTVGGKRPMTEEELKARDKKNKEAKEKDPKSKSDTRTTVDTMFGDGAMTYLYGLIDEMTTGEPQEEVDFKQTEWGKANEMDAVSHFEAITGLHVAYHGISAPKFFKYGDFAGGSPDGEVLEPEADAIIECKCHFDGANHTKKLLIASVDEFKDKFWKEYCQDQMNMIVMGKKNCYSVSYDPRKKDVRLQTKIIRIPIDEEFQKDFDLRLAAAIDMLGDILYSLDKNLFIK